jgi:hypothetical protein
MTGGTAVGARRTTLRCCCLAPSDNVAACSGFLQQTGEAADTLLQQQPMQQHMLQA